MTHESEAAARRAAGRLTAALVEIVGARSVLLHGSLALGGFRPGRSDIDLLAIVDGGLSDSHAQAVTELVGRADLADAAGVDLHVVAAAVAAAPTRTPPLELHVGRYRQVSPALDVVSRVTGVPDLLVELSMARARGQALRGPRPADVIGPVPPPWIVAHGRHWLGVWKTRSDDAENAAFMVLTACRIWHFAVVGGHASKTRAAEWALRRDPSLTAVRQALRQYVDGVPAPIDEAGVVDVLDTVMRGTGDRA